MPYFKDPLSKVHFLDDSAFQYLLPIGSIAITDAEAQTIQNPAPTLDQVKAAKIAELSSDCQAQIYAGFDSSALGSVHHYPAKDKDQANMSGSVVASLLPNLPAGWTTPFWCADSAGNWAFVDHTAAQIQQAGSDAKAAILTALNKNANLAAQVNAATTETAVAAIAW